MNLGSADRRLILASGSPGRAALLAEHGYRFDVIVPPIEEPKRLSPELPPAQLAQALSYLKARSVAEQLIGDVDSSRAQAASSSAQGSPPSLANGLILAADTIAAYGQEIFGKPSDVDDARRILLEITGTSHDVITGVTLLDAATGERRIDHVCTCVTMKTLTEYEMQEYLDTQAWVGKAGAYGIQDTGDQFVTAIDGSFTNVVGLPMELVNDWLSGLATK